MPQNQVTLSGTIINGTGTDTIGPITVTNTASPQPFGDKVLITTNTTTTVTIPTNAIGVVIRGAAATGGLTLSGLPTSSGIIAYSFNAIQGAGNTFTVTTSGITTPTDSVLVTFW